MNFPKPLIRISSPLSNEFFKLSVMDINLERSVALGPEFFEQRVPQANGSAASCGGADQSYGLSGSATSVIHMG